MKQKLTLSARLYLSNLFLILVAVLLTGGLCLRVALSNKQKDLDATILDIANVVSDMGMVQQALED